MTCNICDKCGSEYYTDDQSNEMVAFKNDVLAIAKRFNKQPEVSVEDDYLGYSFKIGRVEYFVVYEEGSYSLYKISRTTLNERILRREQDKQIVLDKLVLLLAVEKEKR